MNDINAVLGQEIYPIDCNCGNYEEEKKDIYTEDCYGIVEYKLYCKNCGKYLGHFVYGAWEY